MSPYLLRSLLGRTGHFPIAAHRYSRFIGWEDHARTGSGCTFVTGGGCGWA